jgi:3'-phosphoadenosine 5'-phosphosulfate sulfotransferase (PAPS reductase)/FAD synthetase
MQPLIAAEVRANRKPLAVVSISGGKDSTATALLALAAYGKAQCRFVFSDPGNEHELTLEYVHDYLPTVLGPVATVRADFSREIANKRIYVETVWPTKGVPDEIIQRALSVLHPTGVPFLDLCLWKGRFPSRKAQFCTQQLKRFPLDQYLLRQMADDWDVESWRGIRRDESSNRKDAPDREIVAEGYVIVHPIASWSAQQTVDFVIRKGVRLNPLYSRGMSRVGCMPCINCNKNELLGIWKRFPEHIEKIREWEHLVSLAAKRGWTTFFSDCLQEGETDEEIFQRMSILERVRWAETAHGGRQLDFLRSAPPPSCSSLYGLCE